MPQGPHIAVPGFFYVLVVGAYEDQKPSALFLFRSTCFSIFEASMFQNACFLFEAVCRNQCEMARVGHPNKFGCYWSDLLESCLGGIRTLYFLFFTNFHVGFVSWLPRSASQLTKWRGRAEIIKFTRTQSAREFRRQTPPVFLCGGFPKAWFGYLFAGACVFQLRWSENIKKW